MAQFLWVILPYLCLAVMIVGSIYRYTYGQLSWTSKSSEILEKGFLRYGSVLFHYGIFAVIGGHVMGLLIPISFYHALGVPDEVYHAVAIYAGGAAGLVTWLGVILLLIRRIFNKRVRKHSSPSDYVTLVLLTIVITLGEFMTTVYSGINGAYEYRTTVGPWFRDIFVFHPNASLMVHVPLVLQIHAIAAWLLFASIPFTRLVHIYSLPWRYPTRAPIQFRSRTRYQRKAYQNKAGQ
jgi:nitrate reductase gamma subunit